MKRLGKLESIGGWIAAASFVVFATMVVDTALAATIASSKHNLGTTGTGTNHVTTGTDEICVFCHTPHGGNIGTAPLWNKNLPATSYQLYGSTGGESATLDGQVLVVGSVSAACLSCHDGTQAMDNMVNAPGSGGYNSGGARPGYTWGGAVAGDGLMPAGVTNLSADLRNDHPIGVQYCGGGITDTGTGTCKDPDFVPIQKATINNIVQFWVDTTAGGGAGTREKGDMILYRRTATAGFGPSVECGSCHDPHNPTNGTFLRVANAGSNLCLSCHVK